ncbi:hypothetical protein HK098_007772 [Nowakowskiella sp. JEL0407]|nr:hypothetical protein HK098_007772 [Nowakowskiella sp. JEL0407]
MCKSRISIAKQRAAESSQPYSKSNSSRQQLLDFPSPMITPEDEKHQTTSIVENTFSQNTQKQQQTVTPPPRTSSKSPELIPPIHPLGKKAAILTLCLIKSYFPSQSQPHLKPVFETKESQLIYLFCNHLINTTHVSSNIVYLSLLYLNRILGSPIRLASASSGLDSDLSSVQQDSGSLSPRQIITTCMMMGSKFHDDRRYSNKLWSKVSGVELSDLNKSEWKCLSAIKYGLFVGEREWSEWKLTVDHIVEQLS